MRCRGSTGEEWTEAAWCWISNEIINKYRIVICLSFPIFCIHLSDCCTVQYSIVHNSTVKHSKVQCSAVQYSKVMFYQISIDVLITSTQYTICISSPIHSIHLSDCCPYVRLVLMVYASDSRIINRTRSIPSIVSAKRKGMREKKWVKRKKRKGSREKEVEKRK